MVHGCFECVGALGGYLVSNARALNLLPSLSQGLEDAELKAEVNDVRYVGILLLGRKEPVCME